MGDTAFERRVKMIEAGKNGDFDTVNKLLPEDTKLESFGDYLLTMVSVDKSIIEKSLSLPNLDESGRYFPGMIRNLVIHAATEDRADIVEIALAKSKAPSADATTALSLIFNSLSEYRTQKNEFPSVEVGQLLLAKGASLETALILPEGQLTAQQRQLDLLKKQVADFKGKLAKPATPAGR